MLIVNQRMLIFKFNPTPQVLNAQNAWGKDYSLTGYVLNFVILSTHSSHHYSIWDFSYMCKHNNLLLTCEPLPLCGLQDLSMAMNKSYSPPLSYGLFPSLVHHSWASTCQPRTSSSMRTSHLTVF